MVKIYSTSWCPSCISAKRFFDTENIKYQEINIEEAGMSRKDLTELTGSGTVPQIGINNISIGGFEDLLRINESGELKKYLKNDSNK